MMFLNELDVLNANTQNGIYRPQAATATTVNGYDAVAAYNLQQQQQQQQQYSKAANSQQAYSLSGPQATISYSTSRHPEGVSAASSNIYQSSIYSTAADQQPQANHLIPFNIIFNPALSCNYNPALQNHPLLATTATPQYPQLTAIPNFTNYHTFPQKYIYKTKLDDYTCALNSDYQYGVVTTKTIMNKYYSKQTTTTNNNSPSANSSSNGTASHQPYYINSKRVLQQQQDNLIPAATTATTEPIYLANTNTAANLLTSINTLDTIPTQAVIPIRGATLQPLSANPRLLSSGCIKKRKKRFKKPIELRKVLPKNSLMLLHELMPNVEYRFVKQSGPIHKPIFTMSVDINEHTFEGVGKTKKEARMMSADKALKFLMQYPEFIQKYKTSKSSTTTAGALNTSPSVNTNDQDDEEMLDHHSSDDDDDEEIESKLQESIDVNNNCVNNEEKSVEAPSVSSTTIIQSLGLIHGNDEADADNDVNFIKTESVEIISSLNSTVNT